MSTNSKSVPQGFIEKGGLFLAKVSAWIGYIFGVGLIIVGIYICVKTQNSSTTYVEQEAIVDKVTVGLDQKSTIQYSYVYQGQTYRQTSSDTSRRQVGDKFTVYVNPDHPEEPVDRSTPSLKLGLVLIAVGVCLIGLNFLLVRLAERTKGISGWLL